MNKEVPYMRKTTSARAKPEQRPSFKSVQEVTDRPAPIKVFVDQKCGLKQSMLLKAQRGIGNGLHPLPGKSGYYAQLFDPKAYVRDGLTERDVIQIKQVFDKLDSTRAGMLTPGDVGKALSRHGYNPLKETSYSIVAEYDPEELGGINFSEFLRIMTEKPPDKERRHEIQKVFNEFDLNRKGYISVKDLHRTSWAVHERLSDAEIRGVFGKCDLDQDGRITFDDFYQVMVRMTYYK